MDLVKENLLTDALAEASEHFCPGPRVSVCIVKFPTKRALHAAIPKIRAAAHLREGKLWLAPSRPPAERDARSKLSAIFQAMKSSLPAACTKDYDISYKSGVIYLGESRVAERTQDGSTKILEDNLINELSAPYGKAAAANMRDAARSH
eukprot:3126884-Amphidinium_carterae.3